MYNSGGKTAGKALSIDEIISKIKKTTYDLWQWELSPWVLHEPLTMHQSVWIYYPYTTTNTQETATKVLQLVEACNWNTSIIDWDVYLPSASLPWEGDVIENRGEPLVALTEVPKDPPMVFLSTFPPETKFLLDKLLSKLVPKARRRLDSRPVLRRLENASP